LSAAKTLGSPPAKTPPLKAPRLAASAAEAEKFLKAIANSHRLMILCELLSGERSVASLQASVDLSQSSLSQHLARLRKDALVKTRRESQTIHYSLADDNVAAVMALLDDLFCTGKHKTARDAKPLASATSKTSAGSRRASRK
jgi:ArsR family transcriptional regulator, virulence genes transcriptional regulator